MDKRVGPDRRQPMRRHPYTNACSDTCAYSGTDSDADACPDTRAYSGTYPCPDADVLIRSRLAFLHRNGCDRRPGYHNRHGYLNRRQR